VLKNEIKKAKDALEKAKNSYEDAFEELEACKKQAAPNKGNLLPVENAFFKAKLEEQVTRECYKLLKIKRRQIILTNAGSCSSVLLILGLLFYFRNKLRAIFSREEI